MQNIRYIGKKPRKVDTVAGTGVIWNGPGDVQPVPDHAVKVLLLHTDSWEPADVKAAAAAAAAADKTPAEPVVPVEPKVEKKEDETQRPTLPNLETMDKDGLKEFALREYGHTFHPNTGEAKMRSTIVGLMNRG